MAKTPNSELNQEQQSMSNTTSKTADEQQSEQAQKQDQSVEAKESAAQGNPSSESVNNAGGSQDNESKNTLIESSAEKRSIENNNASKKTETPLDKAGKVDTNDSGARFIGFTVITIVFGFLFGWSYYAPLDSAAYAPGQVAVEGSRKTVQHLEGGIVTAIHVKEGQLIEQGQPLIELDDTQLKAQLEIIEAQYIAALALSNRLLAEQSKSDSIAFDQYLMDRASNSDVKDVMQVQTQVFNTRKASREGEVAVLKQRIEQLREQNKGLVEQQRSDKKQIKLFNEEIEEAKALLKKGFTDKTRMREMQRRVAELEGEVGQSSSSLAAAKIRIGETKLQILQIENEHQKAVSEQLSQTLTSIADLEERSLAIRDKVVRTKIMAPDSGVVLGMTAHTIGGVVSPGNPILEIVPQGKNLIIEAQVSPIDIDKVREGLISEVRFSSFKMATTPILEGEVLTVSADSLVNKATGMPYFLARIKVTPESYEKLGDELKLMPGMPADTIIKTGERTVFEYLVRPATDAFAKSFIED